MHNKSFDIKKLHVTLKTNRKLTDAVESSVEDHDGLSVSNDLGDGVDQDGQVASHVVHHEEEHSDGGGSDWQWYYLHEDGEYDTEPHLSWKKIMKWWFIGIVWLRNQEK